jgi:hypothetical protein
MAQTPDSFFHKLWQDYLKLTPSAELIHQVIQQVEGKNTIVNDHVAFRTFNLSPINLDTLTPYLEELGYVEQQSYQFDAKHLRAKHFEYPGNIYPKIFISELLVTELSPLSQRIIQGLVKQIPHLSQHCELFYGGRLWELSFADYQQLRDESEYAAWTAAWGFHANHFTVSVNHLTNIPSLATLNQHLKDNDFILNQAGGEIKGGKAVLLAQSSTMADHILCEFTDGSYVIPSCFYEFAERFNAPNGQRYHGFIAASADKIFESTHSK